MRTRGSLMHGGTTPCSPAHTHIIHINKVIFVWYLFPPLVHIAILHISTVYKLRQTPSIGEKCVNTSLNSKNHKFWEYLTVKLYNKSTYKKFETRAFRCIIKYRFYKRAKMQLNNLKHQHHNYPLPMHEKLNLSS